MNVMKASMFIRVQSRSVRTLSGVRIILTACIIYVLNGSNDFVIRRDEILRESSLQSPYLSVPLSHLTRSQASLQSNDNLFIPPSLHCSSWPQPYVSRYAISHLVRLLSFHNFTRFAKPAYSNYCIFKLI